MTTSTTPSPRRPPGRPVLVLGLGVALLGILAYVVQLSLKRLMTPWYMPVAATLGVGLVIVALSRTRNVWRVLALVQVSLIAAATWALLLGGRLPEYTGPIVVGRPFPAFTTTAADGTSFTQSALSGGQDSVVVFFRGRW